MAVASCNSGSGGSNWGGSSFFGGRGLKRDCRDPESNKTLIGCESESNRPGDQGGGVCDAREIEQGIRAKGGRETTKIKSKARA